MTIAARLTAKPRTRGAPGKLKRAVRRKGLRMVRETAPYAASIALAATGAAILRQPDVLMLGLGGAGSVAAVRLHEAFGHHRQGGKAAMRERRKYQGWASRKDIRRLARLGPPGTDSPLILGAARRMAVAVHREKSVLYIGPPGCGKTAALACHAADAPGALFATSTKAALLLDTASYRTGRTWILNADGYGNIPTTLAWSPVEGCHDPQTAMRRAGDLMHGSPRDSSGKDAWHEDRGAKLLRYMLHAAAVAGASMHEVYAWVHDPLSGEPMAILESGRAWPGWAAKLAALLGDGGGDTLSGLAGSASAALGWMDDPVMAAIASPAPGEGFSAREFARSGDSAYLIGKKRPYGSLAPYFAALGAEVFEQLKWHAMESPSGRLPVPATYVLDELPLTCPMPVHDMLAEAREFLITITAGAQSLSQLRSVWGKDDGDTIRSAAPVEVIFGGEKRADDLEALSAVIGKQDTWHHVKAADGSRTKQHGTQSLMPPEALRSLPARQAVILAPACRPVRAATPAIWERPGHVRADLGAFTAPARERRPAVVTPRREVVSAPHAGLLPSPAAADAVLAPAVVHALARAEEDSECPARSVPAAS